MTNVEESLALQRRGLETDGLHSLGAESCLGCVQGWGGLVPHCSTTATEAPHSGPLPSVGLRTEDAGNDFGDAQAGTCLICCLCLLL